MLPIRCKEILQQAAATKDLDEIQQAIDMVKALSPKNFLQNEKDFDARVFYGRPEGGHWSGTYRTLKIR